MTMKDLLYAGYKCGKSYFKLWIGLGVVAFCILVGALRNAKVCELLLQAYKSNGWIDISEVNIGKTSIYIGFPVGLLVFGMLSAVWVRSWKK